MIDRKQLQYLFRPFQYYQESYYDFAKREFGDEAPTAEEIVESIKALDFIKKEDSNE
jgi:hypothetical protein